MQRIDVSSDLSKILETHFSGLHSGGGRSRIRGGQTAANEALEKASISGYARNRSEVLPENRRGATVLSPYIRHNFLTLQQLWKWAGSAPTSDRDKFRDELLWQEYARHLYARVGVRLFQNLRFEQTVASAGDGWKPGMACIDFVVDELESDGWLVNQTRMWLASHWTVRNGKGWLEGQERMYQNLIDGSRAANLLGWQWTVGAGTGKPYGFARWQVEKRAPGLCKSCPLKSACPIDAFPAEQTLAKADFEPLLSADPTLEETRGPSSVVRTETPEYVLLTVDSLGDDDPALKAHPELPAVFVFNEAALRKLQLSSKRIFFYLESLADLAERRETKVFIGNPVEFAGEHAVAVTHAPVPSFKKFKNLAEVHPYPWLRKPHAGPIGSYSAWVRKAL